MARSARAWNWALFRSWISLSSFNFSFMSPQYFQSAGASETLALREPLRFELSISSTFGRSEEGFQFRDGATLLDVGRSNLAGKLDTFDDK